MRRFLAFGFLLVIPATVQAQETYSIAVPAPLVLDLSVILSDTNAETCKRLNLQPGCTQGDACTNANAAGGSGCTPAQARAANARIYPGTQAGREELVAFHIALPRFTELLAHAKGRNTARWCERYRALSASAQNAECSAISQPDQCGICQ